MDGFRSLGDEEEIEFLSKPSDKGQEATIVTAITGDKLKGSHRRPMSKKQVNKKIRCYNCGEFGRHIASKCTEGPQPKKCHHCKSADHLIADCPKKVSNKNTVHADTSNNSIGTTSENSDEKEESGYDEEEGGERAE